MLWADPEGGGTQRVRAPPGKIQKIGFLSNTDPNPLKNHKATKKASQHSMLGHHRPATETPFKWRFAGGPMMALL